jgi:hypothetical protein
MLLPASAQSRPSLRGTAQPGTQFDAGSVAGAIAQITRISSGEVMAGASVRTYLGADLQEDVVAESFGLATFNGVNGLGGNGSLYSIRTTKPFDAVEFTIDGTFDGYTVSVYEICSDVK